VVVVKVLAVPRVRAATVIPCRKQNVGPPTTSQEHGPVLRASVEGPAGAHRCSQVPMLVRLLRMLRGSCKAL